MSLHSTCTRKTLNKWFNTVVQRKYIPYSINRLWQCLSWSMIWLLINTSYQSGMSSNTLSYKTLKGQNIYYILYLEQTLMYIYCIDPRVWLEETVQCLKEVCMGRNSWKKMKRHETLKLLYFRSPLLSLYSRNSSYHWTPKNMYFVPIVIICFMFMTIVLGFEKTWAAFLPFK